MNIYDGTLTEYTYAKQFSGIKRGLRAIAYYLDYIEKLLDIDLLLEETNDTHSNGD